MARVEKTTGTIYKRGNIYWIEYHWDGKPMYESSKSTKVTDTRKLLNKRLGEVAEGKRPGAYFDRVIFNELTDAFVTDRRINRGERSARDAQEKVDCLLKSFDGVRVSRITTARIKKYIEKRQQEGYAPATINRELAAP